MKKRLKVTMEVELPEFTGMEIHEVSSAYRAAIQAAARNVYKTIFEGNPWPPYMSVATEWRDE